MIASPCLIIFAKQPLPGYAKRRMIPLLGPEGAAKLHAWLLERLIEKLSALDGFALQLHCAPDCHHPLFDSLATRYDVTLHPQRGADLGQLMANSLNQALDSAGAALLIGSDLPDLDHHTINQSLALLSEGQQAVFAPSVDGGYGLIGLTRFEQRLFEQIEWGGERVMEQTRRALVESGFVWSELSPKLRDLDRPEDLRQWLARQPDIETELPASLAALLATED